MNTKEKIIQALEEAKGKYISGESLAEIYDLSRTAIWKGINELKKEGYPIESVRNRGYKLSESSDIISKAGIALCLKETVHTKKISGMLDRLYVYDSLDSTNTQAKRELFFGDFGNFHKTVIVAKSQSSGRGHRGSGFDSPEGGIYFSMLLDPGELPKGEPVTGNAANIVTEVLDKMYGVKVRRKKDNSLYFGKEKVCGILTEAVSDLETGVYSSFIVGIGIRADKLVSLSDCNPSKNAVIASLMERFDRI